MANEIKHVFDSPVEFDIDGGSALDFTIASLASSTSGLGRASDLVDNSSNGHQIVQVGLKITQGTSPTGDRAVYLHLLQATSDSSPDVATDEWSGADESLNVYNAPLIGVLRNKSSPSTGEILEGIFTIINPGPYWGLLLHHDTGAALHASAHECWYVGINPEVQ